MSDIPAEPEIAGDRAISPVSGRGPLGRRGKALGVTALAAGVGLFMLATARHPQAHAAPAPTPAREVATFEPAPTLAHPGPDAPSLSSAPAAAPPDGTVPALSPTATASRPADPPPSSPLLAYSRDGDAPYATSGAAVTPTPVAARSIAGVSIARAERLGDRHFLLLAGSAIPCVLLTALDSTTPGLVTCQVSSDVYSDDGAVVLLEKGTRVLGAYSGGTKPGQRRLYVAWTRAVTPQGVAIAMASPAADALGRAGFDGEVDTHPWQRFGGAVLLTLLDGASAALGHAHTSFSLQAPQSAADTALKMSADIAPTLRKAPGSEVSILVAQDLDFSGVYAVGRR